LAEGNEPIKKNAQGKCAEVATHEDGDQRVKLHEKEFLVVEESGSGYGGGAHGWNSLSYKNLNLKTGKLLKITDVIKTDTVAQLKALVRTSLEGRFPEESERESELAALDSAFEHADDLEFRLSTDGIYVSLFNELPYVAQGLDEDGTFVNWSELGDLLNPRSEAARLFKP